MAEETTADTPTEPETEGAPPEAADDKLKQTVEISDVGPCKKHVKITVDRDAIDERFQEKFDDFCVAVLAGEREWRNAVAVCDVDVCAGFDESFRRPKVLVINRAMQRCQVIR